jgi:hypothetical protein
MQNITGLRAALVPESEDTENFRLLGQYELCFRWLMVDGCSISDKAIAL